MFIYPEAEGTDTAPSMDEDFMDITETPCMFDNYAYTSVMGDILYEL